MNNVIAFPSAADRAELRAEAMSQSVVNAADDVTSLEATIRFAFAAETEAAVDCARLYLAEHGFLPVVEGGRIVSLVCYSAEPGAADCGTRAAV